jgi:ZIP family zinc transporter
MALPDLALGALAALAATSFGSIAVVFFRRIGDATRSAMLAFAAGMMAFSCIEMLSQAHASSADAAVIAGVSLGILALFAADKLLPHVHAAVRKKELLAAKKKVLLIVGAISIHNIPEGFAIASAFAGSTPLGWIVTLSIALQDIPEGLLIAAPLVAYGVAVGRSVSLGVLSGAVEFAAAIAAFLFLSAFAGITPVALAFSAGAMLYVILAELLPDALANKMERVAAVSFVAGAAVAFAAASLLAF